MDTYYQRNQRPHKEHKRQHFYFWVLLVIAVLAYAGYCLFRPLAPIIITRDNASLASKQTKVSLPWPAGTESAIGSVSGGILATSAPDQSASPTASIAKLITALTVLQQFPLAIDQEGPIITLTKADVQIYNKYYAEDGSLVKVQAGEQISKHQALEAMLLPSANNMADSLAIWAFGSLAQYRVAGQNEVNTLGLTNTTVGVDASGFDPSTTSTPSDLIKLGQAVLANPLLKQIVGEKSAIVPVAGKINNINYLVGGDGIIGIKTGNSDQAGGCVLFAANYNLDKQNRVTIIGAIQHDSNVIAAMHDAIPLLNAAKQHFALTKVIQAGQPIASATAPWLGKPVPINAQHDLVLPTWQGQDPPLTTTLKKFSAPNLVEPGKHIDAGVKVGQISYGSSASKIALVASRPIPTPSIAWRLTHPF